jgi:hypothetical protein
LRHLTIHAAFLTVALQASSVAARERLPEPVDRLDTRPARLRGCVDVRDFGASANAGTSVQSDSAAAFQATADEALRTGRSICIPAGSYYLSAGFKIEQSETISDATPRPSIVGDGDGTTRLVFGPGDFAGITYVGGRSGAGPHVYAEIRGMRLEKADVRGSALRLSRTAFLSVARVTALGWHVGLEGTDVLLTSVRDTTLVWNHYGAMLARGTFSHPNAIAFSDSRIGNNAECGILAKHPTLLSVQGGEVGANGVTGTSTRRGGIVVDGGPLEGGVGLVADHVYFEGNTGLADVIIQADGASGVHSIHASTFNRVSAKSFATNMVRASGAALVKIDLSANAFKRLGDYSPKPERPYVDMSGATHPDSKLVFSDSNLMDDPVVEGRLRLPPAAPR